MHAAILADAESRGVKRSTVVGEILARHFGIEYRPVPPGINARRLFSLRLLPPVP